MRSSFSAIARRSSAPGGGGGGGGSAGLGGGGCGVPGGGGAGGRGRQEDAELVPAQPCDRVALAKRPLQPGCELLEQDVAGVVAERVVDLLEAVEVHEENGGALPLALGGQDGLPRPVVEEGAVGKAGKRVVERLVLVLLGLAAQPVRGAHDDPDDHEIEEAESAEQEEVDGVRVAGDRRGDGRVREVDLERSARRCLRAELERG